LSSFRAAANRPDVGGEAARHARVTGQTPKSVFHLKSRPELRPQVGQALDGDPFRSRLIRREPPVDIPTGHSPDVQAQGGLQRRHANRALTFERHGAGCRGICRSSPTGGPHDFAHRRCPVITRRLRLL
jgi:hypothetical protein